MMVPFKELKPGSGVMTVSLWASKAQKNEALLYWHGLLMLDRLSRPVLSAIAALLYELALRGEVVLVQHKSGAFEYDYLAVKK